MIAPEVDATRGYCRNNFGTRGRVLSTNNEVSLRQDLFVIPSPSIWANRVWHLAKTGGATKSGTWRPGVRPRSYKWFAHCKVRVRRERCGTAVALQIDHFKPEDGQSLRGEQSNRGEQLRFSPWTRRPSAWTSHFEKFLLVYTRDLRFPILSPKTNLRRGVYKGNIKLLKFNKSTETLSSNFISLSPARDSWVIRGTVRIWIDCKFHGIKGEIWNFQLRW